MIEFNEFEQKIITTGVILLGSAILTLARRWNNKDSSAGLGIAGWAMVIIALMWL